MRNPKNVKLELYFFQKCKKLTRDFCNGDLSNSEVRIEVKVLDQEINALKEDIPKKTFDLIQTRLRSLKKLISFGGVVDGE